MCVCVCTGDIFFYRNGTESSLHSSETYLGAWQLSYRCACVWCEWLYLFYIFLYLTWHTVVTLPWYTYLDVLLDNVRASWKQYSKLNAFNIIIIIIYPLYYHQLLATYGFPSIDICVSLFLPFNYYYPLSLQKKKKNHINKTKKPPPIWSNLPRPLISLLSISRTLLS